MILYLQNVWGLGWFNKAQPTPVLQRLAWRLWTCISHHFCGFHCTLQWSALLQWVGWFGSVLLRHPPGFGLLWPKCYSELLDAENIGITLPGSCFHCFFFKRCWSVTHLLRGDFWSPLPIGPRPNCLQPFCSAWGDDFWKPNETRPSEQFACTLDGRLGSTGCHHDCATCCPIQTHPLKQRYQNLIKVE